MKELQKVLLRIMGGMGRMKVKGLPRALIIILMLLIIGSVCLYIGGWLWLAHSGKIDLGAMNSLLQTLTGASFIAAVGFIGKSLIDDDGNGVPDDWDRKEKIDDNTNIR